MPNFCNSAENTATINQQKRKLSRQHDVLSSLKHKYAASDVKASEENSKLTDEYKRITEQFKDLQVCRRVVCRPSRQRLFGLACDVEVVSSNCDVASPLCVLCEDA
jgi:hypothetical protein